MILNSFTVIMIFISFITGLLSLILFLFTISLYRKTMKILTVEEKVFIDERISLLILLATSVFIIKLLLWPFLYVTLQSYIPLIPGAMCIFGVTQVQPGLSAIIQIIKPLVFFSLGAWFFINKIDEKTERSLLQKKGLIFLASASAISFIDSMVDLFYLAGFDVETYVACCTTVFDLPEKRFSATLSSVFVGKEYHRFVMPCYFLSNILFLSSMVFTLIYYKHTSQFPLFLVLIIGLLGLINASITVISTFESIAPRVMKLPGHHCLYCMWQYAPWSVFFLVVFIIGTFSTLWAVVVQFFRKDKTDKTLSEAIDSYTKRFYLIGVGSVGVTMIAVVIQNCVNFL